MLAIRKCKQCLITDKVPDITINDQGICNLCTDFLTQDHTVAEQQRVQFAANLEHTLANTTGSGEYDCLVPLSGGKDSIYL